MHSGFRVAKVPAKSSKASEKRSNGKKPCRCGSDKKKCEKYGKETKSASSNILPYLKE